MREHVYPWPSDLLLLREEEVDYRVSGAQARDFDPGEGGSSAMAYWLLKSEPDDWSWAEQVAKGRDGAEWTGIRNFSAQNHLRAMKRASWRSSTTPARSARSSASSR